MLFRSCATGRLKTWQDETRRDTGSYIVRLYLREAFFGRKKNKVRINSIIGAFFIKVMLLWANRVMNRGVQGLCGVVVEGRKDLRKEEADCAVPAHVVDVNW